MNWPISRLIRVLLAVVVFTPLGWIQPAWGQFSTFVNGTAAVCNGQFYQKTGQGRIEGQTSDSCKNGTANSSSIAVVGPPGGDAKAKGTTLASKAAGYGRGTDTVTLIPPHGFTGNSVKVTLTDDYAFVITGVSGQRKAETSICWQIPGLLRGACLSQTTNGKSVQTFKKQLTIPKSKLRFQLTVAIGAVAVGTSAGAADGGVSFALPTHWTCTYASGFPCR